MFKYIKFEDVKVTGTTLTFRGNDEDVKVNSFDVNVVSISADDESKIDELIASQPAEINCVEITQSEFKELVKNSAQLNRIRQVVKNKIAKKYDLADEIAMSKKEGDEKEEYLEYVDDCLQLGYGLKLDIGY